MRKGKKASRRIPVRESSTRYDKTYALIMQRDLLRKKITELPPGSSAVKRKLKMWLNYVEEKIND